MIAFAALSLSMAVCACEPSDSGQTQDQVENGSGNSGSQGGTGSQGGSGTENPGSGGSEPGGGQQDTGNDSGNTDNKMKKINIKVNGHELTATLEDNASTKALTEMLEKGDLSIQTEMYGHFEQTGELPHEIAGNDTWMNVGKGDIVLYRSIQICFYYNSNSYSFTRLGRIDNAESLNLKEIYGETGTTFTLSLPKE